MIITDWFKQIWSPVSEKEPAEGYNLWAGSYDNQPDNLILHLDEEIFSELLTAAGINGKIVADIGCGTGRHWEKLYSMNPARLAGYDVSEAMLQQLRVKYPGAETYLLQNNMNLYAGTAFDAIVSTLTVAHIENFETVLKHWDITLKPGADIIITDYHPEALKRNAKRTFKHKGKTISLKSYVYPVDMIREKAKQLGWKELRFTERVIDDSVKPFYEKQNAIALFEKYQGLPLVYGIYFNKEQ